jgi:hypothetical protein
MILVFSLIFLFLALIACHINKKMNDDGKEGFKFASPDFLHINKDTSQLLAKPTQDAPAPQEEKISPPTKSRDPPSRKATKEEQETILIMQDKLQELIGLNNQVKDINEGMKNQK